MSRLPGALGEIAAVAGEAAAIALADARGGTEIWLPRRLPERHWLIDVVGREAAEAICAHYLVTDGDGREIGRMRLVVPKGPTGMMRRAKRRLAEELAAGASVREAARRSGLHERTAWRIKERLSRTKDSQQGELF